MLAPIASVSIDFAYLFFQCVATSISSCVSHTTEVALPILYASQRRNEDEIFSGIKHGLEVSLLKQKNTRVICLCCMFLC
jgi:hypothetical protein